MRLSELDPTVGRLMICQADLKEAKEQNKKIFEALRESVKIIKQWHGDIAFDIYYEKSPEMKNIRSILKDMKS